VKEDVNVKFIMTYLLGRTTHPSFNRIQHTNIQMINKQLIWIFCCQSNVLIFVLVVFVKKLIFLPD